MHDLGVLSISNTEAVVSKIQFTTGEELKLSLCTNLQKSVNFGSIKLILLAPQKHYELLEESGIESRSLYLQLVNNKLCYEDVPN